MHNKTKMCGRYWPDVIWGENLGNIVRLEFAVVNTKTAFRYINFVFIRKIPIFVKMF